MGYGSYIADKVYPEPGGLEGTEGRLPPRARSFDVHFDGSYPLFHGFLRRLLGGQLGGKRGTLAGPLEPGASGAGPGDDIAAYVGDGYDGIIERSINMNLPRSQASFDFLCRGGATR